MGKPIPIYIVTGFLGSGKTTLINSMLTGMEGEKIGVIVNDFGPVCVDASLLGGASARAEKTELTIKELKNGQLFCSCLVSSFIETVVSFSDSGLDALWIEASGLAKPSPLLETLAEIDRRAEGQFTFGGMVCVVDASRFLLLASVLNAIEEQIAYSRVVVVNKVDLVSDSELAKVVESVRSINPDCRILTTAQGSLPKGAFDGDFAEPTMKPANRSYAGWGKPGRPVAFALNGALPLEEARLHAFLAEIAPDSYRIKGFIRTERGIRYVDCVGDDVKIVDPSPNVAPAGLVVISAIGESLQLRAMNLWTGLTA